MSFSLKVKYAVHCFLTYILSAIGLGVFRHIREPFPTTARAKPPSPSDLNPSPTPPTGLAIDLLSMIWTGLKSKIVAADRGTQVDTSKQRALFLVLEEE